ncbi:DHH family phosphoesterase [Mycoplasma todarodis]|uniref:Phosphoesterase n=1 Tax=Mycoplasma todarodis TaxID=1937191 RepID=A0A4R0XIG9_9MOLU|nr:DHHA1 domain-containing protein [Mycoplasma todarodis]TCG10376.1 phosphoesterase [Mycoplasma todarodis]
MKLKLKELQRIWAYISSQKTITICTHIDPDGDTVGTSIALKEFIENNTDVEQVRISGGDIPPMLDFISADIEDDIEDEYFYNSQVIVVDTSNKARIWDKRVVTKEAVKFDHHKETEEWLMGIGGDDWPACGQLLAEIAYMLELKWTEKARVGISIAIVTDTENFTQRNIGPETFNVMAKMLKDGHNYLDVVPKLLPSAKEAEAINKVLSQVSYEYENMVVFFSNDEVTSDIYRAAVGAVSSVSDREVTLFVAPYAGTNILRGGLRSKGNVDVSKIAEALGGGGHHASSGFKAPLGTSLEEIMKVIKEHI